MVESIVLFDNSGENLMFSAASKSVSAASGKSGAENRLVSEPYLPAGATDFLRWYSDDNLFPQNLVKVIAKNEILSRGLPFIASAVLGNGLRYGTISYNADGSASYAIAKNPEIDAFIRNTNVKAYLREAALDLCVFGNIWPQIVLSSDRSKIVGLSNFNSAHCRLSMQNPITGMPDKLFVNADWERFPSYTDEKVVVVPLLDSYYRTADALRVASGLRYAMHLNMPSPGAIFYQEAPWVAITRTKWPELAEKIPLFKVNSMTNQMNVKLHVHAPASYWEREYSNFADMLPEEKKAIKTAWLTAFAKSMQGVEKASSTILTDFLSTPDGKPMDDWKIEVIESKKDDGKYLEDSQEASSHILFSLGLDASLIGSAPGGKMGAGSGSDKRVAFNMLQEQLGTLMDIILEPFYLIRDYNGWPADLDFWIQKSQIVPQSSVSPTNRM